MQPLASLQALADPIYEVFYGLREQPFAITTDPKFFYHAESHRRAFNEIQNGLRRYERILLLTGETGTGKTTLCRAVIEALGERAFSAVMLNPYMSGSDIYRFALRDFGLVSHEELRRGALASADVPQLLDTLEGFLRSLVPLGGQAVIVLDEAQALPPEVLDQIRTLTSLEERDRPLVQVVMCGQPALLQTLKAEPMYALNERITRRVALSPLLPEEVDAYIQHRLVVAGGGDAVQFDPGAVRAVAELSHGLPRRINVLCDRSLQEGRIEGVKVITSELVKRAARAVAGAHDPLAPLPVPDAPPVAAAADADRALTFGQSPGGPTHRVRRFILAGIGALVSASLLGYGFSLYRTAAEGLSGITMPTGPRRDLGTPLSPLPMPAVDPAPSPAQQTPLGSDPLPNNRNQLN